MVKSAGHKQVGEHFVNHHEMGPAVSCTSGGTEHTQNQEFARFPKPQIDAVDRLREEIFTQSTCFLVREQRASLVAGVESTDRALHVTARAAFDYSKTSNLAAAHAQWEADLSRDSEIVTIAQAYSEAFNSRNYEGVAKALRSLFDRAGVIAGVGARSNRQLEYARLVEAERQQGADLGHGSRCDRQLLRVSSERVDALLAEEQEAAVAWVESTVRRLTLQQQEADETNALAFTGFERSLLADALAAAGANTQARQHYRLAAQDAPTQVDALYFRLRAHQQVDPGKRRAMVQELDRKIASARTRLQRGGLSETDTIETAQALEAWGREHDVLTTELASIRAAIPALMRDAVRFDANDVVAGLEPVYAYVPPHLQGTNPETWSDYPTVVVQTRDGKPTDAPPLFLNMGEAAQVQAAPVEDPAHEAWQRLLEFALADADGLPSVPTISLQQDPVVIYQPVDGIEQSVARPGTVSQVRSLYNEVWKQDYLEALRDMSVHGADDDPDEIAQTREQALHRVEQLELELVTVLEGYAQGQPVWPLPGQDPAPQLSTDVDVSQYPLTAPEIMQLTGSAVLMAQRWTSHGGVLDRHHEEYGVDQTERKLQHGELSQVDTSLRSILAGERLDIASGDYALLSAYMRFRWAVDYNGSLAVGRADDALDNVRELFSRYSHSTEVIQQQEKLFRDAPWLFTSVEGEFVLRDHVDLTQQGAYEHLLKQSELAAEREATRYYFHHDDTMNLAMPLGGSVLGGAGGAVLGGLLCAETAPVCLTALVFLGGGLGAGGGTVVNREMHLYRNASRIQAAAQTGLTRVSAQMSAAVQGRWALNLGASAVLASPVGKVGQIAYGPLRRVAVAGAQRATWVQMYSTAEGVAVGALQGLRQAGTQIVSTPLGQTMHAAGTRAMAWGTQAMQSTWAAGTGSARTFAAQLINKGNRWPAVRVLSGVTMMAVDYLGLNENYEFETDFEINTGIGWLGAALLYNESIGQYVLGVNAGGQVVSLAMTGIAEIAIQTIQHRDMMRPDGERIFWFNAISSMSTFIVKSWILGAKHFENFHFGKELLLPLRNALRSKTQFARSVVARPGTVSKWVSPTSQATGQQYLAVNPAKAGQWRVVPNKEGPHFALSRGTTLAADDFLVLHRGIPRDAWNVPTAANGFRFSLKRPLTQAEFASLKYQSPRRWEATTLRNGETGYVLKARPRTGRQDISAKNWLKAVGRDGQWQWNKGAHGKVGGFVPTRSLNYNEYVALNPPSTSGWTPLKAPVAGKDGGARKWFEWKKPRLTPEEYTRLQPVITGKNAVGKFSPSLTFWGSLVNAAGSIGGISALNYFIGSEAQEADPYYLTAHRGVDYGIAIFFTWPRIQIPLGIDTPAAQAAGRSVGMLWRYLGTYPFPSYSEPWIGKDKYARLLGEGGTNGAYEVLSETARSFTNPYFALVDREPGDVEGTWWRLETRALRTIRGYHDELFETVATQSALPTATSTEKYERASRELKTFADMIAHEFHRDGVQGDVEPRSKYEGRLLMAFAAYIKGRVLMNVHADQEPEDSAFRASIGRHVETPATAIYAKSDALPLLTPFISLMEEYPEFFSELPTNATEEDWSVFVRQLNAGYFDDRLKSL